MTEKQVNDALNKKGDAAGLEEKTAKQKQVAQGNVTVACAYPMGLKLALKSKLLVLNGCPVSHIVNAQNGGYLPAGKFGLTIVTKEDWEEVLARYGKTPIITKGMVFAKEVHEEVVEKAQEESKKDLGFEQAKPRRTSRKKKAEELVEEE